MKKIILTGLGLMVLTGCGVLTHMDQLLTLQSMSENQTEQQKFVEAQDKNFEKLLSAIKSESFKSDFPDQKSFEKAFGEPVFAKSTTKNGQNLEEWFYRYAVKFKDSEKVYLYFDASGNLTDFVHIKPEEQMTPHKGAEDAPAEKTEI